MSIVPSAKTLKPSVLKKNKLKNKLKNTKKHAGLADQKKVKKQWQKNEKRKQAAKVLKDQKMQMRTQMHMRRCRLCLLPLMHHLMHQPSARSSPRAHSGLFLMRPAMRSMGDKDQSSALAMRSISCFFKRRRRNRRSSSRGRPWLKCMRLMRTFLYGPGSSSPSAGISNQRS